MDSVPLVVITGQVPTHLIGTDAFQECDTVGITRSATKHNLLVRDVADLPRAIHEAFFVAQSGRPGPVLIDVPKDVQSARGAYAGPGDVRFRHGYAPRLNPDPARIREAAALIAGARRPVLYVGGGVINAGPAASDALRALQAATGAPVTATLMGLGAFPASDPAWLGMVGMHGSFEANQAMHGCDVMVAVGARFDDRVTGRVDAFSPNSTKIHIDVDPTSIGKIVRCDTPVIGDAGRALEALLAEWPSASAGRSRAEQDRRLAPWRAEVDGWRARRSFAFTPSAQEIKPQHAVARLHALTRDRDVYITTEVGQHQMWAAQHFGFEAPNRWMTSGGLGTMGYGLPAAVGVQMARPGALVIDIAGEASIQMMTQELSTAVQYELPVKVFILNNQRLGMVRQWQELLHGGRRAHSYSESLPDFVKLAEAYGATGLRVSDPAELDAAILRMIDTPGPVVVDVRVTPDENCLPMIPSGRAHNDMLLPAEGDAASAVDIGSVIDERGRGLV